MFRKTKPVSFSVFVLLAVLLFSGIRAGKADIFSDPGELRETAQRMLSAYVADARWAMSAESTAIAVYSSETGYGVAILSYDASSGLSVAERNDRMIPRLGSSSSVWLDDHGPEYAVNVWWDDQRENDYIMLRADDSGIWRIRGLEYSRKETGREDTLVFCHLSEDGKTARISPLVDPRIEWDVDQEFTLANFHLDEAQQLCEKALSILRSSSREDDTGVGYRIVHAALDHDEPVLPERFDSRMDQESDLLTLSREDLDGRIRTEWIFHWEQDLEAWILVKAVRTEHEWADPGEIPAVTETASDFSAETVRSVRCLKDGATGEVLYLYHDAAFPNVLDPDALLLKQFNFDTPPVSADGYSWSRNYGAYEDPSLMPKLFEAFFPEDTYADGYLQEDRTLMFIARKPDGSLVLLCGADEGETGWEWTESTPLPEDTRFGDENITDALNLGAWKGGAAVGIRRTARGLWGVCWVNSYDFRVGPDWVGVPGSGADTLFFGTHAWGDVTAIDWSGFPPEEYAGSETAEEKCARLSAYVDRTGWAAPSQKDPYGTTALLAEAGNEDSLLGRFYNGTPLLVLEQESDWTRVSIGHGEGAGVLTGWMRTKDLAFGDDTLQIDRTAIRTKSEQVLLDPAAPLIGSRAGMITAAQFSDSLVIGNIRTDRDYVIVYCLKDGDVGFVPQDCLGNGNG